MRPSRRRRKDTTERMSLERWMMPRLEICRCCSAFSPRNCEKCDGGVRKFGRQWVWKVHFSHVPYFMKAFPKLSLYHLYNYGWNIGGGEKNAPCVCLLCGVLRTERAAASEACGGAGERRAPGCSGWCWWRLPVWSLSGPCSAGHGRDCWRSWVPFCFVFFFFSFLMDALR